MAVGVGAGSTAVAMAAEVHGSIADKRLYRRHLRGAGNHSLSDSCQEQQCLLASSSFPTSEWNVACDYCFEHKVPKHLVEHEDCL